MNPSSGRSKTLAKLADSTHQQLSMYALAASAAGVGALCLTQPAEAKVVYTPANVRIVPNAGLVRIDLNHDGIADFGLSNTFKTLSSVTFAGLEVKRLRPANEIWEVNSTYKSIKFFCGAALPRGTKVGPNGNFHDPRSGLCMAVNDLEYVFGPWLHVKQAYLGLKFLINGKTHFGWARVKVTVTTFRPITATLTGYAYETIPGKAIIAGATSGPDDAEPAASLNTPHPEPATLGALAMGVPGLSIWRRKESAVATLREGKSMPSKKPLVVFVASLSVILGSLTAITPVFAASSEKVLSSFCATTQCADGSTPAPG
jgi:hypothetical protein